MLDRNAVTTYYTYDVHGNETTKQASDLKVVNNFDANGNKTTMDDATGRTARSYDALNRCIIKSVPTIGTSIFTYDEIVDIMAKNTCQKLWKDPSGNITTKIFDKAGRLWKS